LKSVLYCKLVDEAVYENNVYVSVKPNPVSSIRSNVINSTCITLLWETTNSVQFYPKEHLITVSSQGVPVTVSNACKT
jgi:hypothetical protein